MLGYIVQRKGRYNKWENLGIYGDRDSAQFYIERIGQPNRPAAKYRIIQESITNQMIRDWQDADNNGPGR